MSEYIVVPVGERRELRDFLGLFVRNENQAFFMEEVCSFLGWQEEFAVRFLTSLEQQELVAVHRGVVKLTSRGQRALKEFYTRREL